MENLKKRTLKIFATLTAIYGSAWCNQFSDESILNLAIKIWTSELKKFNDNEIKFAIKKCMQHDYPPTLPVFAKMCSIEKSDLNLTTAEISFLTHDKTYAEIVKKIDKWNFVRLSADAALKIYKILYRDHIDKKINKINENFTEKIEFIKQRISDQKMIL
ncbi:MAG: hypothetical protein PVJ67_03880 [Candidatus Pacearchaeota archaeon]|jgi:hypothetical protein